MPGLLRCTCGDYARVFVFSHTRLRVHWAPGIPCALCYQGGETVLANLARSLRRDREAMTEIGAPSLRGAKRRSNPLFLGAAPWIASLAFAMTVSRRAPHSQLSSPGLTGRPSIPEASVIEPKGRGVLDTTLEHVIGLDEGETRWRGMTVEGGRPPALTMTSKAAARSSSKKKPGSRPGFSFIGACPDRDLRHRPVRRHRGVRR
jgi:hypothetical protein